MASQLERLPTVEKVEQAIALHAQLGSLVAVGRKMGLPHATVNKWVKEGYLEGLLERRENAKEQLKLDAQIRRRHREIVTASGSGYNALPQLREEFGVNSKRIWAARHRDTERKSSRKWKQAHHDRNAETNKFRKWAKARERKGQAVPEPHRVFCECVDPRLDRERFCEVCGHIRGIDGTLESRAV